MDYGIQFAKDRKLVGGVENVTDNRLFLAAASYIGVNTKIRDVLSCWEGDGLAVVFGIYVDYRHRRCPPREIIPSRLPPEKRIDLLLRLLQTDDPPKWYRYDDGTYTPWGGELCGFSAEDQEYDLQEEHKWNEDGTRVEDAHDEEEEQEGDHDNDQDDEGGEEEEEGEGGEKGEGAIEDDGERAHETNALSSTFGTCGISVH